MRTIHKYAFPVEGGRIFLPYRARLLSLQLQHEKPIIYCEVNSESPADCPHNIKAYGTGHNLDKLETGALYLGSLLYEEGQLVFHYWLESAASMGFPA